MQLIVITLPGNADDEHRVIIDLFKAGLKKLHVRKPDYSEAELKSWIKKVPGKYRRQLVLHQHYHLVLKMNLGGVHFTERYRKNNYLKRWIIQLRCRMAGHSLSASYHKLNELGRARGSFAYYFFSPVFDSISKSNHKPKYSMRKMYDLLKKKNWLRVVALGGVTPAKISACRDTCFKGVALMGELWQNDDPVTIFKAAKEVCDQME